MNILSERYKTFLLGNLRNPTSLPLSGGYSVTLIAGWSQKKENAPRIRSTPPLAKHLVHYVISDFFWEAQILATCCGSTAVLTEVLCALDKALVLLLCHVVTKLAEMLLVTFVRHLKCCF